MTPSLATAPPPVDHLPAGTAGAVVRRMRSIPRAEHPYRHDPVGYCRDILGLEPWSKQQLILESVRDHRRTAVRSCHGVGKTAIAGAVALWFHDTHGPDCRVVSTAPTFKPGVKDLLWREVRSLFAAANGQIASTLYDTRLERDAKWFAEGYSTDVPERFQGHHAEQLLLIIDEASGVDESIYEAAEGFLTNENARVLLIGNPTQPVGQFHRAFHSERALWNLVHISAFDAPAFTGEPVSPAAEAALVSRMWVEEKRQKWGEDSPLYEVRVLGNFSKTSDDSVCAVGAVELAQQRSKPRGRPLVIGCDVARFGSDETVITVRHGNRVRVVRSYVGQDTMRTVGEVLAVAREEADGRVYLPALTRLVIDDTGVGGGVTDRLREIDEFPVVAFNGGESALVEDDYPNRRSEVWFTFSERLASLDLDGDEQLAADLVAPKYRLDSRARRVVEKKSDTKKRLGRSPDRADAVLLTFAVPDDDRAGDPPAAGRFGTELGGVNGSLTGDLMDRAL